MRRHSEIWTVAGVCRRQATINPQPAYQRGPVWTLPQKQLLIDSILRDLDIPKLYLRELCRDDFLHEVIDGQQRIRAICEFRADYWPLSSECDAVAGQKLAGRKFSQVSDTVKDLYDQYELHFVILRDAEQEEVEEMFLRLQNGTTLKSAEKRNAMPGEMGRFVRELVKHPFFARLPFDNYRFTHDELAAQMTLLELEGVPTDVRSRHLEKMYCDHLDFEHGSAPAAKVRRVLSFLARAFKEKFAGLKKTAALSLYLLVSRLLDHFALEGREAEFRGWFHRFCKEQEADEALPEDRRDSRSVFYQEHCDRRTTSVESLGYRHDYLAISLLTAMPDLERADRKPVFTREQKLAVWTRDAGVCRVGKICRGAKCGWDEFEVQPILGWAEGGKATVANGRAACPDCMKAAYAKAS
jgi:hypothetical protein